MIFKNYLLTYLFSLSKAHLHMPMNAWRKASIEKIYVLGLLTKCVVLGKSLKSFSSLH